MRDFVRNYEVNAYSFPVSTVPAGGWQRGDIARIGTVRFRSSTWDLYQYDPTAPETWNNNG